MIAGAILLACAGWAFTFGLPWGNFWIKIGCAVVLVCAYSLFWRKPRLRWSARSVVFGALSAALLYGVFWVGDAVAPYVIPGARHQVGGIYDLGQGSSKLAIFFLLMFVTGPGEEIFWRGFLQGSLEERLGRWPAYLLTTLVYAGVHVFSGNPMLIVAALVAGAFWGAMYAWKRDLAAQIVSHSLWTGFIFAVVPIHG